MPDVNGRPNVRPAKQLTVGRRFQPELKVTADLFQSVPELGGVFKQRAVFRVAQAEVI